MFQNLYFQNRRKKSDFERLHSMIGIDAQTVGVEMNYVIPTDTNTTCSQKQNSVETLRRFGQIWCINLGLLHECIDV